MLFNSLQFAWFFVAVTTAYFILPHKFRWLLLLAASCLFYMAFVPAYILILFFTITTDFFAAILIEKKHGPKRKFFLLASIVANLLVLCFFKYFNFFVGNLLLLAHATGWQIPLPYLAIVLPIGLSFHTFQAISYTVEVYRGNQKAEKHYGIFALYVMFWPQLVAGPIERPQNLLRQFYEKHSFNYNAATSGLKLMAWGLFKKVVVADRLAETVNKVYDEPMLFQGLPLLMATLFFAVQIYCDFSGYSDIALGAARLMGFRLTENFRRPYFSTSVISFWRNWHISLSTWFRDYVYKPLGGNKVNKPRLCFNLLVTFLLSGLWHGAAWHFIVWGGINGLAVTAEVFVKKIPVDIGHYIGTAFKKVAGWFATCIVICIAWIFFRAENLHDAFYILKNIFSSPAKNGWGEISNNRFIAMYDLLVVVVSCIVLFWVEYKQQKISINSWIGEKPVHVRWAMYVLLAVSIIMFGVFDQENRFIYFQF
jgi:alginate O-acetyltransferase complex protein AlgI